MATKSLFRINRHGEIRKILRQAWSCYVHTQTAHRKGITAMPCDVFIQHRRLSDQTLHLILLDLVGGYQTGTVKAIWDSTQSNKCEFCGAVDNHTHRQLQCPDFAHLRADHPQAVESLQSHPNLLWLPLATVHPQQVVYNRLKWCRTGPFLDHPDIRLTAHNEFYTDGTCDLPRVQNCCRAAWSVVQKVAHNAMDPSLDHFVVSQTSHTKGPQTVNRSELEAVCWLVEYFHQNFPIAKVSVYTDSSFVQKSIEILQILMYHDWHILTCFGDYKWPGIRSTIRYLRLSPTGNWRTPQMWMTYTPF